MTMRLLDWFTSLLESEYFRWDIEVQDKCIDNLLELCDHDKLAETVSDEFNDRFMFGRMTPLEARFWDKLADRLDVHLDALDDIRPRFPHLFS